MLNFAHFPLENNVALSFLGPQDRRNVGLREKLLLFCRPYHFSSASSWRHGTDTERKPHDIQQGIGDYKEVGIS